MRFNRLAATPWRRVSLLVGICLLSSSVAVVLPPVTIAGADVQSVTFSTPGTAPAWTVPAGVTAVAVDVFGAQGGGTYGGPGGRVQATLAVSPGDVLNVSVGGQGTNSSGGVNGGGTGQSQGSGGGGASDIRRNGSTLGDRVVVAGGGGGAGEGATSTRSGGGAGGGPNGADGGQGVTCGTPGRGATTLAGGAGGSGVNGASSGILGQGGDGAPAPADGGGGGAGYYGGGGGGGCDSLPGNGGGGGSSWVGAIGSAVRYDAGVRTGNG